MTRIPKKSQFADKEEKNKQNKNNKKAKRGKNKQKSQRERVIDDDESSGDNNSDSETDNDSTTDEGEESSNNNEDKGDKLNVLQKLKKKKEKKLKKDLLTSVSDPITYAIRLLPLRFPALASTIREAILLRAKAPNSTSWRDILKDESLLEFDPILVQNIVLELFETEYDSLVQKKEKKKAKALKKCIDKLARVLIRDGLLIKAKTAKGAWAAIVDDDPTLMESVPTYLKENKRIVQIQSNLITNLNRVTGTCFAYNSYGGCDAGSSCKFGHYCLGQHDTKMYHSFNRCPFNQARGRGRSRGRFRGYRHFGNRGPRGNRGNRARFRGASN